MSEINEHTKRHIVYQRCKTMCAELNQDMPIKWPKGTSAAYYKLYTELRNSSAAPVDEELERCSAKRLAKQEVKRKAMTAERTEADGMAAWRRQRDELTGLRAEWRLLEYKRRANWVKERETKRPVSLINDRFNDMYQRLYDNHLRFMERMHLYRNVEEYERAVSVYTTMYDNINGCYDNWIALKTEQDARRKEQDARRKEHEHHGHTRDEYLRRLLESMRGPDDYMTLGIQRGATKIEIKKSYRKLAVKLHPDKGGKPEDFRKLNEAFERLIK